MVSITVTTVDSFIEGTVVIAIEQLVKVIRTCNNVVERKQKNIDNKETYLSGHDTIIVNYKKKVCTFHNRKRRCSISTVSAVPPTEYGY